jgi:outer membrane protein TolC
MKWERIKGTWLIALMTLSVGCATTGKQPVHRTIANKPSAPSIHTPDFETARSEDDLGRTPNTVQLVSGQFTSQPKRPHNDETEAGRDFLRPPAIPAAPEAIEENLVAIVPQGEPLTLEVLEAMACQNNPTLLQAQGQIEGELGKAIQAGLWPNPTLSYVQEQIGVNGTPGEFVGGTISQRIVTGHKLDLSRAKFLARTQAAEWHALEQQYRVLNDVRVHYFRARGHYDLVQIHRELLKSAEDNVLTTREQYNVGQATRAQVHLANVALQRARLDLLRNENDYRQSFEALTALVGVDLPLAPLATSLEGDLTPVDYQDALVRLVSQSPQLQAARSKLESDRITIRRELVEPVPDIVVEAGVGRNFEADQTTAAARVGIELPIFDRNQGTIRQAEADFARQQGEIRRLELILKQELARTYRDYLTALQHATNYGEVILPEARSAYELQLRSYKDDRITWPEVLRTQENYFMFRAEYIRNLMAWRENEILISGFLLHGGLMAPSAPPPPGHINAVPKPR